MPPPLGRGRAEGSSAHEGQAEEGAAAGAGAALRVAGADLLDMTTLPSARVRSALRGTIWRWPSVMIVTYLPPRRSARCLS